MQQKHHNASIISLTGCAIHTKTINQTELSQKLKTLTNITLHSAHKAETY